MSANAAFRGTRQTKTSKSHQELVSSDLRNDAGLDEKGPNDGKSKRVLVQQKVFLLDVGTPRYM